jgi:hypothetical protein
MNMHRSHVLTALPLCTAWLPAAPVSAVGEMWQHEQANCEQLALLKPLVCGLIAYGK